MNACSKPAASHARAASTSADMTETRLSGEPLYAPEVEEGDGAVLVEEVVPRMWVGVEEPMAVQVENTKRKMASPQRERMASSAAVAVDQGLPWTYSVTRTRPVENSG